MTAEPRSGRALDEAAALRRNGRTDRAIPLLIEVVRRAPDDAEALQELGQAFAETGDIGQALGCLVQALDRDASLPTAGRMLSDLLAHNQITADDPRIARVVQACFERPDINAQHQVRTALNLLAQRPHVRRAAALAADGDAAGTPLWSRLPAAFCRDPLLLALLQRGINRDAALERLLTRLRAEALRWRSLPETPEVLVLAAALARQCFNNEHVFWAEADETATADAVAERAEAALERPAEATDLPLLLLLTALYRPLFDLSRPERLLSLEDTGPAWLAELILSQVPDRLEERRLAERLPVLGPISDAVSQRVRSHYERNPYPRWLSLTVPEPGLRARQVARLGLAQPAEDGRYRVLIAGGGTGQQSISTALAYGDKADVLAIDISLASLSYGARMAARYDCGNLRFAQADLLQADRLGGAFDVVECAGVLVCVADPLEAWRRLKSSLAPGGLMYIGLYSERARQDVVAAREEIRRLGLTADPDDMRRFRRHVMAQGHLPWAAELLASPSFFSLSTCRDMLFHEVEHRFTLPWIADALRTLDLRFLEFDLPHGLFAQFRRVMGPRADMRDLALWDRFEADRPKLFRGMYRFWCQA